MEKEGGKEGGEGGMRGGADVLRGEKEGGGGVLVEVERRRGGEGDMFG